MKLQLAKRCEGEPPVGWLYSEKLDGMRGYWTGKEMLSRLGNPIHMPDWFKAFLPPVGLDGELWTTRGGLHTTLSICRKLCPIDSEWKNVLYRPFADPSGTRRNWELNQFLDPFKNKFILPVQQFDGGDWKRYYSDILEIGGEGLIFLNPMAYYERRRSPNCLKYKPLDTFDATITAVTYHENGRLQSVDVTGVVDDKDIYVTIGTGFSEEERRQKWSVGDRFIVQFTGMTAYNVPREARRMS